jgi:ABC-2 type transport system ATP-binding protein
MTTKNAIEIRGVRKTFGPKVAVSDLDLVVPRGALLGFIGPNGAGKTTTIRMIMSIIFPDEGELSVLGKKSAVESKDRIGYLPEERGVYKKMKVGAFLKYIAHLKGVPAAGMDRRVVGWLERVQLPGVTNKKCEELSKGMQQKVQFIASVIHEPELVILDEPFSGLDPVNMRLLRDLIRELHESGTTVIFSTHVMAQAESLCNRIVMVHRGHKMLDDPLNVIQQRFDPAALRFEPFDDSASRESIVMLPGVERAGRVEGHWELTLEPGRDPAGSIPLISQAMPTARIEVKRPTLEDVFVQIVEGDVSLEALRADEQEEASV